MLTGDSVITAKDTDASMAVADGSATGGSAGVGVAVAINVADVSSRAFLAGNVNLTANTLTIEALLPKTTFSAQATSGAGNSKSVGVAGSLAINVGTADEEATINGGGTVALTVPTVTLHADSITSNSANAGARQTVGASSGIGASVAINVGTGLAAAGA